MSEASHNAKASRSAFQRLLQAASSQIARHSSSLLLFMVFCVVIAVGMFMIGDLHTATDQAQRMYAGSVQGLRQIGELQYEAQETRRSTLYALTTNDSNLQVEYADQSRKADGLVTEGIAQYLAGAHIPRELELGQRLQRDWAAYLKVRDEVLASILEGSTKEAVDMDLTGGVPSFDRVRQDLEEVLGEPEVIVHARTERTTEQQIATCAIRKSVEGTGTHLLGRTEADGVCAAVDAAHHIGNEERRVLEAIGEHDQSLLVVARDRVERVACELEAIAD